MSVFPRFLRHFVSLGPFVFAAAAITGLVAIALAQSHRTPLAPLPEGLSEATFAGGCFWCMEPPFEKARGVREVISGFTGGPEKNPTYQDVSSGHTGHVEAVRVRFDPQIIGYETLLAIYFRSMDPTDDGGQFADRGDQYRPVIFVHDARQRRLAERAKKKLAKSGVFKSPIVVRILAAGPFYPAEDYHQDYYKKNPDDYHRYRRASGREGFLERTWRGRPGPELGHAGRRYRRPSDAELRRMLTPEQFRVTQEEATEPPFQNAYWNEKRAGIFVDIVSGEPLFSSKDKFKSGTGWPSFTRPLEPTHVDEHVDRTLGMVRTELRSHYGQSHLGHVFDDGPPPTGLRYCINSAALRFVPKERLRQEGYGEYAHLFE